MLSFGEQSVCNGVPGIEDILLELPLKPMGIGPLKRGRQGLNVLHSMSSLAVQENGHFQILFLGDWVVLLPLSAELTLSTQKKKKKEKERYCTWKGEVMSKLGDHYL